MQKDPYHTDDKTGKLSGPLYAKEVKEARDCIARILEDDYCKKERKAHNKKYGKLSIDWEAGKKNPTLGLVHNQGGMPGKFMCAVGIYGLP
jgi:hypothetical protein